MKVFIIIFAAILIALVVYFGLGWVAKDITFSMMDINDNTTLEEIANIDLIVYASLAGVYITLCLLFIMEKIDNDKLLSILLFPFAAYCISKYLIPPSMGSAVLFNLLNISGMTISTVLAMVVLTEE